MLRTIANAFSVADIRKKLAFTAAMLLLSFAVLLVVNGLQGRLQRKGRE